MDPALLDTDMLSEVLKQKHPHVVRNAATYFQEHGRFAFSSITRYEVLRGLLEKSATNQLSRFTTFCGQCLILPISDAVLDRAAELWSAARKAGNPARDADLIIAATAIEHGRLLVTGNRRHYEWIGLTLQDWRVD